MKLQIHGKINVAEYARKLRHKAMDLKAVSFQVLVGGKETWESNIQLDSEFFECEIEIDEEARDHTLVQLNCILISSMRSASLIKSTEFLFCKK